MIPTGSQSPSSLWLILVNPVVKMFPSRVKMALIGRMPSCGARRSCHAGIVNGKHFLWVIFRVFTNTRVHLWLYVSVRARDVDQNVGLFSGQSRLLLRAKVRAYEI